MEKDFGVCHVIENNPMENYFFCSCSRLHIPPKKPIPKINLSDSSVCPVSIPKVSKKLKRGANERDHAEFVETDRWLEQKNSLFSPPTIMLSASVSVERISTRRDNRILR